ncbi:MAG: hypothetical protein QM802_03760 [Agriterribacter sp.]
MRNQVIETPQIKVITDQNEVARLREIIKKNINLQKQLEAKEKAKNTTLWDRYKQNDKTVVTTLIKILKGNDAEERAQIYNGLEKNYNDPESYNITEAELINQLLLGIQNPIDEEDAVQLAGFNKLPTYEAHFQDRLLSGKSKDVGRIFYWLCEGIPNNVVIDYIATRIKTKDLPKKDLDNIISAIETLGEKSDKEIQKRIGELGLFIYHNKMIDPKRIEDLKNSAMTSDAAESLLNCIFSYGDKEAIPIANDILQRNIRIVGPVKALIRLEGPQHIKKIYTYLRNDDTFYTGLDLTESIDSNLVTKELLREVLIQASKKKEINIDRVVNLFVEYKAEYILKDANKIISNKKFVADINDTYNRTKISYEEIMNDLLRLKLIDKMPHNEVILKIWKEADKQPTSFIYGILDLQKIYTNFDAETDFLPVTYDKLLLDFAEKSEGTLKDMLVWMDSKQGNVQNAFQYTITVLSNDRVFITNPQDIGDWYDVMTVNAILEKILDNLKSKKRFISIDTGDQTVQYIFGYPESVKELISKYKLQ